MKSKSITVLFIQFSVLFVHGQSASNQIPNINKLDSIITATNSKFSSDSDDASKAIAMRNFVKSLPTFGLYGIGNLNTETFKELNSSGKLSGYIRPYKQRDYVTINFAFNVNASNNDELLPSTFLFPDVGTNSFYSTFEYSIPVSWRDQIYIISPLFEFSNKWIKATKDEQERFFHTLSYTIGCSFQFLYITGNDKVSFAVTPYWAAVNVPDEDNKDYRYLFTSDENSTLSSSIMSIGGKIAFQYNNFQFFANFRGVLGDEHEIPIRELRGHNSSIGVVFNAEIFEK